MAPLSGANQSERLTRRRSTGDGTAIPCGRPSVLIHMQRALWMWPASIWTERRGEPAEAPPETISGSCSTR